MATKHSWDMQDNETIPAYAAFRDYMMQGVKRTLERTAKNTGLSMSSMQNWSIQNAWKDRVRDFEQQQMTAFVGQAIDLIVNNQSEITTDMLVDYNKMIQLWRAYFNRINEKMLSSLNAESDSAEDDLTVAAMQKLISVRRAIDDMGRRAIGLSLNGAGKLDSGDKLPENQKLSLPSFIEGGGDDDDEPDFDPEDD